jgi:cell division septation protein DedD
MISPEGYAVERGYVLDELAPIMAMPEGRSPHRAAATEPDAPQAGQAETPKGAASQAAPGPHAPVKQDDAKGDGAHVHLASYRSEEAAMKGWASLQKQHGDLLGELKPRVNEVDLGPGKGIFFRVEAGPLSDQQSAAALCQKLKSRKMFCTVTA